MELEADTGKLTHMFSDSVPLEGAGVGSDFFTG